MATTNFFMVDSSFFEHHALRRAFRCREISSHNLIRRFRENISPPPVIGAGALFVTM
jgi:hypothetical protein